MNVLLFHPHKETLEMMSFCLESQMGLTVHRAMTFQKAIDFFLEEGSIDLVVTSQEPETDKLFKYLLSTNANIAVVLIREEAQEKVEVYPDIRVLGQILRREVPDKLIQLIQKNFSEILKGSIDSEYCRINTELLVRVVPLRGNIYIRLSSVKFVKLFRTGAVFTNDDLERFLVKKKVSFLYINKADSQEFILKFKEDLALLVEQAKDGDPALFATVGEVQELIQELSSRLGFTKEVQQLVRSNIQLTVKAIGNSPSLTKVLSDSKLSSKNYISSHSVLLANVACSIAAQMQWPSNATYQKLTMAALFHDFVFQDPDLAKISTKKELEALHLSPTDEKLLAIKGHPIRGSEIVKNLSEVPADVDVIVSQHHERPDGTGFPKGLRAHQIAPLAAVIIVAHDILDRINRDGDRFDLKLFLRRSEPDYQGGSFRQIWKNLSSQEPEKLVSEGGKPAA